MNVRLMRLGPPGGAANPHAIVSAEAEAPAWRVVEWVTKLQARGLDPSIGFLVPLRR